MAERALTSDRIPCCVPFCRRTAPRAGRFEHSEEIICGKHWRLARAARRRAYARMLREIDRTPGIREYGHFQAGSPARLRAVKLWRVSGRLWAALRREIIEAAAGIA